MRVFKSWAVSILWHGCLQLDMLFLYLVVSTAVCASVYLSFRQCFFTAVTGCSNSKFGRVVRLVLTPKWKPRVHRWRCAQVISRVIREAERAMDVKQVLGTWCIIDTCTESGVVALRMSSDVLRCSQQPDPRAPQLLISWHRAISI